MAPQAALQAKREAAQWRRLRGKPRNHFTKSSMCWFGSPRDFFFNLDTGVGLISVEAYQWM